MEKTRPILYGVADYAQIRKKNAWFVDRTAKIRDLENIAYAVFFRPRRFGKSLLTAILEAYYDVRYADRFDEFFAGTDIGANPTDERGKYLVLKFDFSAVSKNAQEVQASFNKYVADCCDAFVMNYADVLPSGLPEAVLKEPMAGDKFNKIALRMKNAGKKLYVIIDEYDNFTNTILAESGVNAYNALCHGDGFFKDFFARLKAATSGTEAPVTRLFVTGVSPVTMDDVTSGFNIGTNISLDPQFADFTGFRHDDLRAITDYYAPRCGFNADEAYDAAITWYDNYRFGCASAPSVANTTSVLYFFDKLVRAKVWPNDMVDENLRTDYAKIRHLVTMDRRLNGNFHVIENLLAGGTLEEPIVKSFQAKTLSKKENFAVRDGVEGEKVVQSTLVALLTAAKGPYLVSHEREAGGGFYDLALAPRLDRWPDIAHAALIEMKYVKAGDPAPVPEQLAKIKSEAIDQLDQYSSDPALVAKWHIAPVGVASVPPVEAATNTALPRVTLHRLVLVFHGGDCVLAEEV